MIEFTDVTIREGKGHFNLVSELMEEDIGDSDWMLSSLAEVRLSSGINFTYSLHLWKSGVVDIFDTNRPMTIDITEDDIRELREWCHDNNWTKLSVNDRLLVDPRSFDFWMHIYRCGLVYNKELSKFDTSEIERLNSGDNNVN